MKLRSLVTGAVALPTMLLFASSSFAAGDIKELQMTDEQVEAMAGQKPPLIRSIAPDAWSNATGTEVGENIPEQGQDGEGLEKWIDYVPAQRGEPVAPAPEEEYVHEEVIFGKKYRIWPGPKEGTYVVSWGDQSILWEPKPWQAESLQKAGPIMYERWVQPSIPYPWSDSMEERQDYAGADIHDRAYAALYFGEAGMGFMTKWDVEMFSADGTPRHTQGYEWVTAYRRDTGGLADELVGKVRANYSFVLIAPDDVRGLGVAVTLYHGEKYNDVFLYAPASRKVRRLPQASRQDTIPRTILHFEDHFQVKPYMDMDYVVTGTTIHNGAPAGTFGENYETESEKRNMGIDGIGEPAWVYEIRPHDESYWYAKQRRVIGMKTISGWYEESYNRKGELTRKRVNRRALVADDKRMMNGDGPFVLPGDEGMTNQLGGYELMWGGEYFTDMKSGFIMGAYMNTFYWNYATMPRDIVNLENLRKEPVRKILFWE